MNPSDYSYKIVRSHRKTVSLTVDKTGQIIVKAPYGVPEEFIDGFVRRNTAFIDKNRGKRQAVENAAENIGAYTAQDIDRMKEKAKNVFPGAVKYYAGLVGRPFGRITVRRQTTRWGSCSGKGNISLNILLCDCPEQVMLSVIAHEACHLKYKNHGDGFYSELYRIFPDYDRCRKWLNDNGSVLQKRYDMYLANRRGS